MRGGKGKPSQVILSWSTLIFPRFFHLQVAIKIIDKTQLNPSSLQKVRPGKGSSVGVGLGGGSSRPPTLLFPLSSSCSAKFVS